MGRFFARARGSRWLALSVLLAGTCLIVLDFFIVNVALPSMQDELHADAAALEWVVAGYGLAFVILLLAAGRVSDAIGRRRTFTAGIALFTLASAGCGLAPSTGVLIGARLLQGASGALISASTLALISVLYVGADRVRAISSYATVMGLAAASGQLVGGLLLTANIAGLGWRLVFLINVPVGVAALAVVGRWVPESRAAARSRIDLGGLVLATLAVTALVLPLVDGRQQGWPEWSIVSLIAAAPLFAAFAGYQLAVANRGGTPLLDPALFRQRTFGVGLLTQLAFWTGQASYFLVLALYLQLGRNLDALRAGLVFSILAGAYLVASMSAARLSRRYGRTVIVGGALALAAGHLAAVAAVEVAGPVLLLTPGLLLAGAGMGLCIAPLTGVILAHVEPERAGAGSGLLSTVQQLGNSVGVAVIGIIFFGQLHVGYPHAFEVSLGALALLLVGVAGCARLLPGPAR